MRVSVRVVTAAAAAGLVATVVAVWIGSGLADPGPPGAGQVLYVSNTSGSGLAGPGVPPDLDLGPGPLPAPPHPPVPGGLHGCASAAYTTIGAAVAAASPNDTIVVCPGVYTEDVVIPAGKPLTLEGIGDPTIDALGKDNGVQVLASGSTVEGLTVAYATGEGILVGALPGNPGTTVSDVTIRDNVVADNDRGNPTGALTSSSPYAECNQAPGNIPGDCGEGIHLLSADDSTVDGNWVTGNSGGILLTDENGPTDGNEISNNETFSNAEDCGITLAGHHAGTLSNGVWSPVSPTLGGVFDNTVEENTSLDNGVLGQGGGVLLATGAPGGAVDDNIVRHNTLSGNGLAGVTVHAHGPGENLNGNTIRDNTIGTNNLDGDDDFAPSVDAQTTGVVVATKSSPIAITIEGNRIAFDTYGIWTTGPVTDTTGPPPNTFVGVTTPTFP